MKEVWKDVPGFEGVYQVSNMGRVKTMPRKVGTVFRKEKILKQTIENGYFSVRLYNGKRIGRHFRVSRIVAMAFCENDNPKEKTEVNHKNENQLDNRAENLEWCTREYNCNYGTRNTRIAKNIQKEVICLSNDGNIVRIFSSIKEAGIWASGHNVGFSNISACLRGRTSTAYGYKWKYKNDDESDE